MGIRVAHMVLSGCGWQTPFWWSTRHNQSAACEQPCDIILSALQGGHECAGGVDSYCKPPLRGDILLDSTYVLPCMQACSTQKVRGANIGTSPVRMLLSGGDS
jgi:hypothetical protein